MKFKRFRIRKEYFGCLVHDRYKDRMLMLDGESFELLREAKNDINSIDERTKEKLYEFGFVTRDEQIDYELFENTVTKDVLSAPLTVHYVYTHKCNLNCKHCYSKRADFTKEMTYDKKLEFLDQVAKTGAFKILIGGGEPFIDKNFISFLKASVSRGLYTRTFTNGLLLTDEMIEELSTIPLGGISVSVDSPKCEVYSKIRGVDGLSTVVSNIKKLSEKCTYSVSFSITVNSTNLNNEDELLDLAKESGVKRLKVRPTKPSGNALKNTEIEVTPTTYADYVKRIVKSYYSKGYDTAFALDINWGHMRLKTDAKQIDVQNNPLPYSEYSCIAGRGIIAVSPDGSVNPCGFLSSYYGEGSDNAVSTPLIQIWKESNSLCNRESVLPNTHCVKCRYYSSCRGGCPARILHVNGKANTIDPWCPENIFPIKLEVDNK